MQRRKFIQLGAAALALSGCTVTSKSNARPNVLFIAIDDLNTWIGCLSHLRKDVPSAVTPNLDKLARQGMLFTNAHTPVPWCMPARNNMLTGMYANDSHIYSSELFRDFLPSVRTLPQHFMDNGYHTLAAGKIFHDTYPDVASWNEYEQFPRPPSQRQQKPALNGLNDEKMNGAEPDSMDWGAINVEDKQLTDSKIADWVINALGRDFEKPFFMAAGFRFPHLPWYLPEHYLAKYPLDSISLPWVKEDDLDDVPPLGKKMALYDPFVKELSFENSDHGRIVKAKKWKNAVQAYLAAITCVDEQLGRVMEALDNGRYAKNTLVVLWSDNGFHLGEKLHWRKFTLWDQATRIPLIMRVPGVTNANTQTAQAVSLVDVYPTLVQLAGLPLPKHHLSGESLVPLLINPSALKKTPAYITYGKGNDSVVDEHWRYIRYEDGTEELYDHRVDNHEWHNLSEKQEYFSEKQRLKAFLS